MASHPTAEAEARQAAEALLQAIQPLREASRALTQALDGARNRARLERHLRLLPPLMMEWFDGWLRSGEALADALSDRFSTLDREAQLSGDIFANTVSLVCALRAALRHEAAFSPDLPSALDEHVFGLWDALRRPRRSPTPALEQPPLFDEAEDTEVG